MQPSLSMGIQDAQGKGRGQDLSEAALLGGEKGERRGTTPLSRCLRRRQRSSRFPPPTLNLYLLYLFNCWRLAAVLRNLFPLVLVGGGPSA